MKYDIVDAFRILCGNKYTWSTTSNTYESIKWSEPNELGKPTEEECNAKLIELNKMILNFIENNKEKKVLPNFLLYYRDNKKITIYKINNKFNLSELNKYYK